jgi:hypothetical protein
MAWWIKVFGPTLYSYHLHSEALTPKGAPRTLREIAMSQLTDTFSVNEAV